MPRIPRAVIDEMVAHAREAMPNEACGMVHAKDGMPFEVHRVKNIAGDEGDGSPYRYVMDPMQQFRLEERRDETGETLFAIYHSHVRSEARPSQTDVRQAFFPPGEIERDPAYPDTHYILVSLAEEPPPVRAFHIRKGGAVEEVPIEVV